MDRALAAILGVSVAFALARRSRTPPSDAAVDAPTPDQSKHNVESVMAVDRGTSNSNLRGNTRDRLVRRQWLVDTFRADVDHNGEPACRCYRCGCLLTASTLTVDRIIPGCQGGRYVRGNIRPACGPCNSATGAPIRRTA